MKSIVIGWCTLRIRSVMNITLRGSKPSRSSFSEVL